LTWQSTGRQLRNSAQICGAATARFPLPPGKGQDEGVDAEFCRRPPSGPLSLWERVRVREGLLRSSKNSGVERARELRRRETDAERKLWMRPRDHQLAGAKFRRQQPLGRFVADFCCLEHKLVIEVDGGQHASNVESDRARSAFLERYGYRVLRFWDHEVLQN